MTCEISGSHGGECEDDCSGILHRVVWYKFTSVSEVLAATIIRAMEAAGFSETSVNIYQTTRRSIPEDSHIRVLALFHCFLFLLFLQFLLYVFSMQV
jgi:hypothetical protein